MAEHPCGCPGHVRITDSRSHEAYHRVVAEQTGLQRGPINAETLQAARGFAGIGAEDHKTREKNLRTGKSSPGWRREASREPEPGVLDRAREHYGDRMTPRLEAAAAALEPEGKVYSRHDALPTSQQAAKRATPGAKTQAGRVLRCVVDAGTEGVTDEQISDRLGMPLNTVRPRRLELVERGLVADSGDEGVTRSGAAAILWMATLDGVAAVERADP